MAPTTPNLVPTQRRRSKPTRDWAVLVRFTAQERRVLDAIKGKQSYSSYVRNQVLREGQTRGKPPRIHQETYAQLSRVASNLNQLTRAVNAIQKQGGTVPANLNRSLHDLRTVVQQLRVELSSLPPTESGERAEAGER